MTQTAIDIDAWNRDHPVGSKVLVRLDDGREVLRLVKVRAQPTSDGGVAWIEGLSGTVPLSQIRSLGS